MDRHPRVGREEVVGLGELTRGVLSIAWRIPTILAQLARIKRFRGDTPLSLGAVLERNAARYPERTALLFEDRSYTHEELNGEVNRFAHDLAARGVGKGDVAQVLLDNRPELLMIVGALAKLGARDDGDPEGQEERAEAGGLRPGPIIRSSVRSPARSPFSTAGSCPPPRARDPHGPRRRSFLSGRTRQASRYMIRTRSGSGSEYR